MKYFTALILANADVNLQDHQAPLLRMELTFAINDDRLTPENVVKGTLHDLRLTGWMSVASIEPAEVDELPAPEVLSIADYEDQRCLTCGKRHTNPEVVGPNGVHFWPGHEYIIETKTSQQRYARRWRMGYLGLGLDLEFSARGPDRTHGGQYGGTQHIPLSSIIAAQEVPRDDKLRHTGRQVRTGGVIK